MVEQLIPTIGFCELHAAAITDARRRQAKRAKPAPVTITVDEMMLILRQRGFVCALSGLPFWDEIAAYGPSIPSIDRVDAWLGYVSGNVRVIRLGVNGLGGGGTDEDVYRTAKALLAYRRCAAAFKAWATRRTQLTA